MNMNYPVIDLNSSSGQTTNTTASMPYIVLLKSIGWKMVDSGLLPTDEDTCYRQKMDVYGDYLVARKEEHRNVTFEFV